MKLYYAPLEGITGYVYRNAHHKYYGGIDKYFTPFLSPTQNKAFTAKERNDVLPEHNRNICVVPQILTNRADYYLHTERELMEYGYTELNLNLGCPSRTVVTKKKGAGFLSDPEMLERFLDEIFQKTNASISVKTRIGLDDPEEFEKLCTIFMKFPIAELTIHPRTAKEGYSGTIHEDVFSYAEENSTLALCYNGEIHTRDDYKLLLERHPKLQAVMMGRGLLKAPMLAEEILESDSIDEKRFWAFHEEILNGYIEIMSGERNTLFKMKELWFYWINMFPGKDKSYKRLKKATRIEEYKNAVEDICNF